MSKIRLEATAIDLRFDESILEQVQQAHDYLHQNGGSAGHGFLGWIDPPAESGELAEELLGAAAYIRGKADVLLVIGIGGSYAGGRAGIEMLTHPFRNQLPPEQRNGPEIYFLGQNLSASYIKGLLSILEDRDVIVNVISKSGTTTETAIAFRIVLGWMHNKYGAKETARRIIATTDRSKGNLRRISEAGDYRTFDIPEDVAGRYSVLTPVGLLPMAVAGIDIQSMLRGARDARDQYSTCDLTQNICYQYAVARNKLLNQGKLIEILVSYEPGMALFAEWWKQLFGESEGKDGKGIFPASVQFTTDLHSIGQYVQQGPRHLFETILWVEDAHCNVELPELAGDPDELNYLAGKTLNFVNEQAFFGALQAHTEGDVPNLVLRIPRLDAQHVGHLFYFFEKACALSGYLLGVNPFDQPGVEMSKRNMFKLLGKSGSTL
ncbi:glucose-6-phosphate isomerase [Tumebacillus avium]|uniref:Glucose-6-phosphate isomerase n=1 Tax=Tumebacillus avium TaxID=1903704 RepID=A0A1Y0IJW0_9BACL|nr:glucose-6-phosphate isomerase [Tumebacillus avium]ARU60379.1 glucose-6-phosphate isomerase [Tumebacillus avium]